MKKDIKKPVREKFDTTAFVFNTKVEIIKEALQRLHDQEADPNAEPLTKDEIYWLGWWELNMPELERRGLTEVMPEDQERRG
ncbi:hypothetical protein [Salmonella phage NINP13076]|nr:hypothetical protein [Salmonella phage NINP13076]